MNSDAPTPKPDPKQSKQQRPSGGGSAGRRELGWSGWRLTAWAVGIMLVPPLALLLVPDSEIWTVAWFAYAQPIVAMVFGVIWGRRCEHPGELWQLPAAIAGVSALVVLLFMRPFDAVPATVIVVETFVVGMIGTLVGLGLRKLSGK